MRKGKNVWVNADGEQIKSETRPRSKEYIADPCPENDFFPDWPEYRVRGYKYTPYHGGSEWEEAANHSMSWAAQDNFQNRR